MGTAPRDLSNIDANTGKRLIARTVKRLPVLLREVELFSDACSGDWKPPGWRSNLGPNGWGVSLTSDEEATLETAARPSSASITGTSIWNPPAMLLITSVAEPDRQSRVRISAGRSPWAELLEIQLNRVLNAEIARARQRARCSAAA